jgi:hypothetical protein
VTAALGAFFRGLNHVVKVAAEAQLRIDRELATGFCGLQLLQPNEHRLSDLTAFLLNPSGAHGQGCTFLEVFIETFEIQGVRPERANCHVRREWPTDAGFLDILVQLGSPQPFAIGIENKPFAGDREAQVKGYCDNLERRFPQQWWFAYLSGNGQPPSDYSIPEARRNQLKAEGRYRTIPFARTLDSREPSIEDWLARCVERCQAERIRWFLRDFLQYIRTNPVFASEPA